jgi:hypothetical protein
VFEMPFYFIPIELGSQHKGCEGAKLIWFELNCPGFFTIPNISQKSAGQTLPSFTRSLHSESDRASQDDSDDHKLIPDRYRPMSALEPDYVARLQDEFQIQSRELDDIERGYDQWEANLSLTERRLDEIEPLLQIFCNPDSSVKAIVDGLEATYQELEKAVEKLRQERPSSDRQAKIGEVDRGLVSLSATLDQPSAISSLELLTTRSSSH